MEGKSVALTQEIKEPYPKVATGGSGKSSQKGKPKAKSMAPGAKSSQGPIMDQEEWPVDPEDFMLVQQELAAEYPDIQHLESRMLNMENALTKVIAHLEKITVNMDNKPNEDK